MRLSRFSLITAALGILWAGEAAAQRSGEGVQSTECCFPVLFPVSARTVSLGQALTTRGGADAMFFNPAGLVEVDDDYFYAHRSSFVDAQVNTFSVLIHSRLAGVFGLTYRLIDFGEQDVTESPGAPTGTISIIDQVLIASFATTLRKSWSAGVSYKLYDFRSTCAGFCGPDAIFSGTTHLLDFGTQFRPPRTTNLIIGAAIMHSGLSLQFKNAAQADPSPTRARLGASYEAGRHFVKDSTIQVWIYADAVTRLSDLGTPAINIGAEVGLNETIFLRAGNASSGDGIALGGAGLGVGLRYQRFNIDVAKTFTTALGGPEGEPVHISFGVRF